MRFEMLQIKVGNKSIKASYLGFITLLFIYWCDRTILSYFKGFIDSSEVLLSVYSFFVLSITVICWLFIIKDVINNISILDLVIICFFVSFYIVSIYDANTKIYALENANIFFFTALPLYFLGKIFPRGEEEKEKVFDFLYIASFWGVVLAILYTFYVLFTGRNWTGADNMAHAYSVLFSLLYIIWYKGNKLKKSNTIIIIIGFAYLVAMGTRGALLAALVWWLVCFLIQKENGRTKKILVISGIILLAIFVISGLMQSIIVSLFGVFSKLGLNIRIFEYYLSHDIGNANGRELIYSNLSRYISEVDGISGFFYDRVANNGVYAHNIFIELLVDFGKVFGGLLIALLVFMIYGGVRRANDNNSREFILLFVVGILIKLMLSSSFLNEPFFFFMLGLLANNIRIKYKRVSS